MPGDKFITGGDAVVFASKTMGDVYDRIQILGDGRIATGDGTAAPAVSFIPAATATAYTQTYSTAARTVPAATATAHTYPASGNLFDAVAADLLINVRTDSTANAVADVVVNEKSIAANLNQAIADNLANTKLINALIDDLQARGIVG